MACRSAACCNSSIAFIAETSGSFGMSFSDTATRERGIDIVAERDGRRMLVEVKGYPSRYHVRGDRKGQVKKTHPSIQARVWFSDLLLSCMINATNEPQAAVVMCMPDVSTYRSLVEQSASRSLFEIVWVSEVGDVSWGDAKSDGVGREPLHQHLHSLVTGDPIRTIGQQKPNWITAVDRENIWVETEKSRQEGTGPQPVPVDWAESAYQTLWERGDLTIQDLAPKAEHRSAFIFALLASMPSVRSEANPRRLTLLS